MIRQVVVQTLMIPVKKFKRKSEEKKITIYSIYSNRITVITVFIFVKFDLIFRYSIFGFSFSNAVE